MKLVSIKRLKRKMYDISEDILKITKRKLRNYLI